MSALVSELIAARLRALTPARVGLGLAGVSQQTRDVLDFQSAHARARDAVHARMETVAVAREVAAASGLEVMQLHSAARDRATYLQRPDLGRRLNEPSRTELTTWVQAHKEPWDLVLVVADGLSALAVEQQAPALAKELMPRLNGWRLGPVCVVEQGRVAVGDEIGEAMGALLALVLIGERPGLSSPASLGAYITWKPRVGRTDAERNCISNIRAEGLSSVRAAAQLRFYLTEARRRNLTGVALKGMSHQLEEGERE